MRGGWLLALSALYGCGALLPVEVPEGDYDYGYLLITNPVGQPARVSPAFAVKNGQLVRGQLPRLLADEEQDRALFVTFDDAMLLQAVATFDAERPDALGLRVERPPAAPAAALPGGSLGRVLDLAVPKSAHWYEGSLSDGAAPVPLADASVPLETLTLRVPIVGDLCPDDGGTLLPFTGEGFALEALADEGRDHIDIHGARWLDAESVAIYTDARLLHLHKGRPFSGAPGELLSAMAVTSTPGTRFTGMSVLDRAGPDPQLAVCFGVGLDGPEPSGFGVVAELSLEPDRIRIVRTATHAFRFSDVTTGADGEAVFLDEVGHSLVFAAERLVPLLPQVTILPGDDELLLYTGDRDLPFLLASNSQLAVWDTGAAAWDIDSFRVDDTGTLSLVPQAIAARLDDDNQLELWAGGTNGYLIKRVGNRGWAQVAVDLGAAYEPCDPLLRLYPDLRFNEQIRAIEPGEHDLYLGLAGCSAIGRTHAGGCTSVIQVPSSDAIMNSSRDLQALHASPEWGLLVAGEEGQLYWRQAAR